MIEEHALTTPDGRLNFARLQLAPESQPPLVLLHGVTRRWQDYVNVIPRLAPRHPIVALDFRGHGKSDRTPGAYRVVDFVRDAVALLRETTDTPAVIYGHSLGALVAAAAAAEVPDAVRAIILEDPPFKTLAREIHASPFGPYFQQLRDAVRPDGTITEVSRRIADVRIPLPGGSDTVRLGDVRDEAMIRYGARCMTIMDVEVFDSLLGDAWLDGYDDERIWAAIRCPVLLLQADVAAGGMLADATAERAASAIDDCTRVRLDSVPHDMRHYAPESVLRLVSVFLETL